MSRSLVLSAALLLASIALIPPADAASHKTVGKPAKAHKAHKAPAKPVDPPPQAFGERADLMQFAVDLADSQGWDAVELQAQLAQAQSMPVVQRLIMPGPAGTAKDWAAYRKRFIEPRRLKAGLAFWEQNETALAQAETRFGVPAELIVGLIGVETFYGQITGGFRVIWP